MERRKKDRRRGAERREAERLAEVERRDRWRDELRAMRCPRCDGEVASILYGLPDFSPALIEDMGEGLIVLGGCVVFGDEPRWACRRCHHRWGAFPSSDPGGTTDPA